MGSRLYVGRLSWRASASDLEQFFRGYGRIIDIILKNALAFVEFDDPRDAEDAVHDLNGRELCGERVTIEFTRPARARFGRPDRFLPPRRSCNCYKLVC
ncbi:unnamed protein product [Toxocara canis]|uniref:RRM domain-containing protein n=1 Tax=Toxocara canis TaxID=6265 RepID=A0A183VHA4_TOXCA|nr:unnamed protein product [Toxocara canis]